MKTIFSLFIITIVTILSTNNSGCHKPNTDCGCDAPTRTTIPSSTSLIGTIRYSSQNVPNGYIFKNKFFITYIEANCVNCVHYMIVCNEDILPPTVLGLKNDTTQQKTIKFAGNLKLTCDKLYAPADYTYENIFLTKIEMQ